MTHIEKLIRLCRSSATRSIIAASCGFILVLLAVVVHGNQTMSPLAGRVGEFRASGPATSVEGAVNDVSLSAFPIIRATTRSYLGAENERLTVTLIEARTEPAAYALLTALAEEARRTEPLTGSDAVGTWSYVGSNRAIFFKGGTVVLIESRSPITPEKLIDLARELAEPLDRGEGDIPSLVRHLPEWETAQNRAVFAVTLEGLQAAVGHRPALNAVSFAGGAEAVTAPYGAARLVIVEHTTPQFAAENDRRITGHLQDLKDAGQPLPSLYRRIGNYSVFVFDAPDEAFARRLADSISYEQVVRWLGHNPHAWERLERAYSRMTAGIVVSTLKATGVALLFCLGIGAIVGGFVFSRRRTRAARFRNYTDAGDMIRLNIDEMTAQNDPSRLLGSAKSSR